MTETFRMPGLRPARPWRAWASAGMRSTLNTCSAQQGEQRRLVPRAGADLEHPLAAR